MSEFVRDMIREITSGIDDELDTRISELEAALAAEKEKAGQEADKAYAQGLEAGKASNSEAADEWYKATTELRSELAAEKEKVDRLRKRGQEVLDSGGNDEAIYYFKHALEDTE